MTDRLADECHGYDLDGNPVALFDEPAEPAYKAGDTLRFTYPEEYSRSIDSNLPYFAHSGQIVTIVRPLNDPDEYENLGDPMYRCRADDGWEGDIWESELEPLPLPVGFV